ncbi:SURF1 family protein [Brevibacterium sp. p3-SID960]|uniref:SURF1 family cytochrome oxidase biogenesis protein n=1 Tax=Brevibacterium sp. p3-SID960 TaxID=2916063 RepID=UPI0021A51BF8|nr:SURF1 family protein [Brevibacterium sp. p3-SID960]MCT1691468.1 SURF1 family protein [Brevibacterium sp. p3-SID960]
MAAESYHFILSSRWLRYIALAVVAAIACGFLANWQNNRREARDAEIAHINANYHGDAEPLSAILPERDTALPDELDWKRFEARGTYDADSTILVRNRSLDGQAGFYVLVPLTTEAGGELAVVRGWVPTGQTGEAPDLSALPAPPAGEVTITGWLRTPQDASAETASENTIRSIDPVIVPGMSAPYTGAYAQLDAEDPAPAERMTALPPPSTDPGSHLSYTFQWIVFGIMILGGVVYAARRERISRDLEAAEQAGRVPRTDYVVVDKDAIAAGRSRGRAGTPAGRASRYGSAGPRRAVGRRGAPAATPAGATAVTARRKQGSAEDAEDALLDEQGF